VFRLEQLETLQRQAETQGVVTILAQSTVSVGDSEELTTNQVHERLLETLAQLEASEKSLARLKEENQRLESMMHVSDVSAVNSLLQSRQEDQMISQTGNSLKHTN
jgi:cell shape-determining protein MreC